MQFKDDPEIVDTFITETTDHLNTIENGLLKLEKLDDGIDIGIIDEMFRSAHTLKAGANLIDARNIEILAHEMENLFVSLREKRLGLNESLVNDLLYAIDNIREMLSLFAYSHEFKIAAALKRLHSHFLRI